jgi:hypothetical protein
MRSMAVARPVFGLHRHHHRREARVVLRGLEAGGHGGDEALDDRLRLHADDRVVGAGHPEVRAVRRSLGQDAVIAGGDVGMGAHDRGDGAVEVIAEGRLLRAGLGVHVHDDHGRFLAQLLDLARAQGEGVVHGAVHEHAAAEVEHRHRDV